MLGGLGCLCAGLFGGVVLGFDVGLLECCLWVVVAGWFSCRPSVGWFVC